MPSAVLRERNMTYEIPALPQCPLCRPQGETVVAETPEFRIVDAKDARFPGYFRLIWKPHVKEMSDLQTSEAIMLWAALLQVERAVCHTMDPDKVNLAEFGTQVPHLHWHIIPRFKDDACFPDSIWSESKRATPEEVLEERRRKAKECAALIKKTFEGS